MHLMEIMSLWKFSMVSVFSNMFYGKKNEIPEMPEINRKLSK